MNGLKVQNNMSSVNALNRMNRNVAGAKKSTEKLASGFRINRAGDDAAGLGVSGKMRSLILALDMNIRNTSDGINMIDVADGAMASMHTIQQRMREIALASTNGIYTDDDREFMDLEYQALKAELDRIVNVTEFNGIKIFHQDRYLTVGAADKTFSTVSFNDNHVVNQYNDTLNFYFNGDLKTLRLDRKTYTNDELVDAINAEFARLGVDVTAEIDPVTGSLSYDANGNVFDSFSGNMMSATLPNSIISNIITPGYSNLYHEGRGGVIVNPGGQKPSDTYGDYLRDDVWTFNSSSYSSIFGTLSNGDPYPFAVSVSSPHQLIPPPAIITNLVHVPAVTPNDGTVGSGNPE
ncbi:MAG: flagellin, partial [Oscillospiraceae bacterium]|nr:flagellin [Oscillospiraceae bacterium]